MQICPIGPGENTFRRPSESPRNGLRSEQSGCQTEPASAFQAPPVHRGDQSHRPWHDTGARIPENGGLVLKTRAVTNTLAAIFAVAAFGATAPAWAYKACAVTDTGGVDDKGFNQNTWEGVQAAAKKGGFEAKILESKAETDYVPNLNSFVAEKCDVIITVGFLLGDATKAAAEANPEHQVHHRRLRLRPDDPQRPRPGLRDQPGRLPRRLSRRRRLEDRRRSAPSAASTSDRR